MNKQLANTTNAMVILIFACVISGFVFSAKGDARDSRKLQIGVKKRAENCTIKSKRGDLLHVKYKGMFENGKVFDTSGDRVFTFTLGGGQVIRGWDQGLMGMCISELRKLVIPPQLAYGNYGVPPTIPGNATLIFHIDLVSVERTE